jgi:hypothetical protein
MVLEGRLSLREATRRMPVSYRYAKRLKGVVARDGPGELIHGNKGRTAFHLVVLRWRERQGNLFRDSWCYHCIATV